MANLLIRSILVVCTLWLRHSCSQLVVSLIFATIYRSFHALTLVLVVIYTAVGGLKAAFLTDFLHTTIALTLLIYFTVAVLTNEHVGGISGLYNKVSALDVQIDGNYAGSLLTFKSHDAIVWSVVLRIGNLALVVMVR